MKLHTEILTENAKLQLRLLTKFKEDFYLAGGTAMALQVGHRISVDFDFFSHEPIKKTLLAKVEETFVGEKIEILINNSRELTLFAGGVKYTFLHYPFPVLLNLIETDYLRLLPVVEILATKAYSIGRRGSLKDYVDLCFGIASGTVNISAIIKLAEEKYGEVFNGRLFLEQLLYMDDVEDVEIISKAENVLYHKDDLRVFFEREIGKI